MNITLRAGKATEAAAISELAGETFPAACPSDMPETAIADFIDRELSTEKFEYYLGDEERFMLLVAEAEGRLLAYTLVDLQPENPPADVATPVAYFSKIYAHEDARGIGVANAIVDEALEEVRQQGFKTAYLGTNQKNDRANVFYAKRGFEIVGTREFDVTGGVILHDFVRAKKL